MREREREKKWSVGKRDSCPIFFGQFPAGGKQGPDKETKK